MSIVFKKRTHSMKTNNGYDINENQCIDKCARQFIFKNQIQWIVVARWKQNPKVLMKF